MVNPVLCDVLVRPLLTEKTYQKENLFCFKIAKFANKLLVKRALEELFGVKVVAVNVMNTKGHLKHVKGRRVQTSGFKKAMVRLAPGFELDFMGKVK